MTRLPVRIAAVMAIAAATALAAVARGQAGQAGVLWLAVSTVGPDGRLLADLTAGDFVVEDHGEPQEVAVFRNDPIPIAVSIMVDVSASMEANYGLVRRAVSALTSHFEPGDRAVIGAFDALPWISPRFSARPEVIQQDLAVALSGTALSGTLGLCDGDWIDRSSLSTRNTGSDFGARTEFARRMAIHGGSAIWDGAACGVNAAASDGETPRRIVILVTDGMDTMSFSTLPQVVERATRFGVMIYAVSLMGGYGMAGGDLRQLAESTGGGYFFLTGGDDVAGTFRRIGDELRHQYVLGVTPTGALDGPHELVVRANVPGSRTRFRRVTLGAPAALSAATADARATQREPGAPVDAPLPASFDGRSARPAVVAAEAPAPAAVRSPVWDMLDAFASSTWHSGEAPRMTADQLRGMVNGLRQGGDAWIAAAPPSGRDGRRVAAAGFVLDLLYSQNDPVAWLDRQPAPDLVDWGARTLQAMPPSPEERLWYFGVLALCERGGAASLLERTARRAAGRFPDEARFVLARAIAEDLRTWPEERDVRAFRPASDVTARLIARYEEAAALTSVAAEATLRLAYFDLRRGRVDAALERFGTIDRALVAGDVTLRFWVHLLNGRALEQAGRLEDAIESYRLALDDVPAATSARSALIAALSAAGRGPEATRLARETLLTPGAAIDPWTIYVEPDMRFWAAIADRLREAVTR
ncbi:MAG: VWA domain-containing protein [Vicinamibacterales bacterium]